MEKKRTIALKKKYGQHFLRDSTVTDHMIQAVKLSDQTSIFEIGGGDGFLTKAILKEPLSRLWVFEIDPEWAAFLHKNIYDKRLTIFDKNFLDIDFAMFESSTWTVLSNLPYQVTFPILHRFVQHRQLINEGVVMVQEEVAQKILKQQGKGYGFISLYFQYYFEWKKLDKISPGAFIPPPKVFSRLLYFKPKINPPAIPREESFWHFIKACFHQPRRTLKNNLTQTQYELARIPEKILQLRAQQMTFDDLLSVWQLLQH